MGGEKEEWTESSGSRQFLGPDRNVTKPNATAKYGWRVGGGIKC
jgi:hypothetical protein